MNELGVRYMNKYNIADIKKRVYGIERVLDLAYFLGIIITIILFITVIAISPSPYGRFDAIKGNSDWLLSYKYQNNSSLNLSMPFYIIQPLDKRMFVAKSAFLTLLIESIVIKAPLILYGIKQGINIIGVINTASTPFSTKSVRCLKHLSFVIILYSLFGDTLLSLMCWIFVTKIFLLNLQVIHIGGVIIGVVILALSAIFEYGVYLQNELDEKDNTLL